MNVSPITPQTVAVDQGGKPTSPFFRLMDSLIKQVNRYTARAVGRATLVAGTVTVADTDQVFLDALSSTAVILLTCQTPGGTPGFLRVSARVDRTSFTITSSDAADTSVVGWAIFEPDR